MFPITANPATAQGAPAGLKICNVNQAERPVRGLDDVAQVQGAEVHAAFVQMVDEACQGRQQIQPVGFAFT